MFSKDVYQIVGRNESGIKNKKKVPLDKIACITKHTIALAVNNNINKIPISYDFLETRQELRCRLH